MTNRYILVELTAADHDHLDDNEHEHVRRMLDRFYGSVRVADVTDLMDPHGPGAQFAVWAEPRLS